VSTTASANPASASACDAPSPARSDWFRQEVHAHDEQLKSYLRLAFPAVRDVEDIVQESYLRTWRRQSSQPIRAAKAFLFTVARRLSIDWLRRERAAVVDTVEDLDALPVLEEGKSTADVVASDEMTALLVAAVDALPARCREVVIRRKFQLLSARETALQLGLKEATVEMQLSRGNARIRAYLAARGVTSVLGHDA
jgi:RNA polymerase sigma factor (sigma-70 family)